MTCEVKKKLGKRKMCIRDRPDSTAAYEPGDRGKAVSLRGQRQAICKPNLFQAPHRGRPAHEAQAARGAARAKGMISGGRPQGRPPIPLSVEAGVDEVDILLVELFLGKPQPLAEALEVHDLARTQELDDVVDVGIVGKAQDVIVGHARLLLWGDFVRTTLHNII